MMEEIKGDEAEGGIESEQYFPKWKKCEMQMFPLSLPDVDWRIPPRTREKLLFLLLPLNRPSGPSLSQSDD